MCFSARASFTSSAVLGVISVAAVARAKTHGERMLALVPVFFCLQQFTEGFVWLGMMHERYRHLLKPATYGFLVFAQIVWPSMVPVTVLLNETDRKKHRIIQALTVIGFGLSAMLTVFTFIYPVQAVIDGHHIKYVVGFPLADTPVSGVIYLLPTLIPPSISSIRPLRWLGLLFVASFIIAVLIYREWVISVWCYFAALISAFTLYVIYYLQRSRQGSGEYADMSTPSLN